MFVGLVTIDSTIDSQEYDDVTGLGAPNVPAFIHDLSQNIDDVLANGGTAWAATGPPSRRRGRGPWVMIKLTAPKSFRRPTHRFR